MAGACKGSTFSVLPVVSRYVKDIIANDVLRLLYYKDILRLPLTSLKETFGLIARPLPFTHNVYKCVFAHASV